ncbi:deleted in malignant brain tumors 1 protein, partial [Mytilus galloprovincialis]
YCNNNILILYLKIWFSFIQSIQNWTILHNLQTINIFNRHPLIYQAAHFGQGSGKIWIDKANCQGTEEDISSCIGRYRAKSITRLRYVTEWGHHACSHSEDISISCKTQIRLMNGRTETEGRLEVYNNNQWGTVCDNAFNVNSAKVVCRMLGYDTKFAEAFGGASYGEGIGSVMMNNVRCVGNEIDIGDCSFDGWRSGNCSHSKDVGVSCGAKVRLVAGINEAQGRVEIHHNGHWGMICDESFGSNEGKVICRMLGYDDSYAKERSVACRIPLRLVGGGSLNEGRLEVSLDEQWGTVCSDGFDINDARVVCKSLGYDVLEPEITTKFGEGFGRVMMAQLSCSGIEQGLSECGFISGKQYNCGHGNDVGIICRTDVRLINGNSPDEGRTEIKYNNIYGSICSSDFDMVDARVFCSMLGYNNPYPEICNSCFGNSNGALHFTNVNCTGDELDITKCSSAGWQNANCSSGSDAGVFCKTRVRLYGGDNPSEGRLEVNHNQIWGTVCSDDFDIADAKVICSMLGYNTSNPRIWTQNYTHGSGSAWMSKLGCYGTEDDIAACAFPGWGKGGCQSSKYMNIGCGIGVRLTEGLVPNEGRVEVYHEDQWGTICNDGFTVQNAKVICRMLGFETKNVTILPPSHFKPSSLRWGQHNCQHSDDVSISCGRTPIRLVNGTRLTSGRLEVYHNNVWGTVCSKNFDIEDATVVCKSLGFDAKYPYVVPTPYFGSGNGLILLENLGCMGNETDISNCSSNGWGHSDCTHDQDVSLLCDFTNDDCVSLKTDTFARLVDGPDSSSGRVELLHNGEWGTLCDDGFDIPDAAVICTMLGYNNTNPHVIYAPHFAYGSGSIFLKNIECAGNESDIEECSHSAWGVTDCKHSEDVGIDCTTDVRLVGGKGPFEGRLEVFHNGEWGTVCDSEFDASDAVVICKMLGYQQSNPAVIPISKIKPGFGPIWMGNLTCSGDEVDIALCKFGGWGHTGHCVHSQDIAMTCGATTEVRLNGGSGKSEGRLEIAYGVTWLPVCESGFTMNSAKVVCRHFGFPVSKNDPSVVQSTDFVNDWSTSAYTVVCTGGELDLALCNITLLANSSCSSGSYVGISCPKTDIRLISQFLPSSGRVEMYHEGRWGSVCGHSFDAKAAEVMCRMLGFKADGSKFFRNSKFGKSAELPWMDNLVCSGYENDVTGCRFTWSSRACNDDANIGLECSSTPIRLVNGAGPWEGRVEILNGEQWNTICDDGFNVAEASVICKMLGFKELYTSPRAKLSSLFGASNSAARLGLMSCSGTELDIHACIRGIWGPTTCSSSQEAGVDCRESNLRLTGGSHSMEGRVELLVNGMWSAVCDDDWDNVEATIVCKTLSTFPFDRRVSGKAFRNSFFGHGTGKIAYSSVKCNGTEIDVMHCTLKEVAVPTCDHSNEAGVSCSFAEQIKLSRPVGTTAEGTVFININGDWNTLCDKDFGNQEAQTVCRELGYWSSNVQFFSNSWFGEGNGTSQDLRPQCMGTETKISFCSSEKSWNEMTCSHADDAGVQCTPTTLDTSNVRLIDGDKPGKGRIEVKYNNHWGSFCWRRWNEQNTKVFCKMLKYSHTEGKSFLAKRNGSAILIGSLRCHGQEDNIGLCKAFMDKETCTDEAVGVDCTGEMNVRLNDGQDRYEGRVDIYDGHNWGSLCDNTISLNEAKVICSTATGYRDTLPVFYHLSNPEFHSSAFVVDTLTCAGWEEHISQCTFSKSGSCSVHFTHVKCFPECVSVNNSKTGSIKSNNYPQPYEPNTDCLYIIHPPTGIYKIEFLDLQMADSGDYVE